MTHWNESTHRFITFLSAVFVFMLLLKLSLLGALYSGLLTYALVTVMSQRILRFVPHTGRADMLAASVVAVFVVLALLLLGLVINAQIRSGNIQTVIVEMGRILISAREWLHPSIAEAIPEQKELLAAAGDWLRSNAALIGEVGIGTLKTLGHVLIGILLGAMIGVSDVTRTGELGPVATRLVQQINALRDAFWRVVVAQVKISALNTTLTAIYLMVALPLGDVNIPFAKTLVLITFVAGLLPVIGNLISNTSIVVISFSVSLNAALGSLTFLVLIHKLEYFFNARIVGHQIAARAWEILLSMLIMERIFGLPGLVAGPVVYAWLKREWHLWDRVRPG